MEKELLERLQVARQKVNLVQQNGDIWRRFFQSDRSKEESGTGNESQKRVCDYDTKSVTTADPSNTHIKSHKGDRSVENKSSEFKSFSVDVIKDKTIEENLCAVKYPKETTGEEKLSSSEKELLSEVKSSEEKNNKDEDDKGEDDSGKGGLSEIKPSEEYSEPLSSTEPEAKSEKYVGKSSELEVAICKASTATTFCGSTPFCPSTTSFFSQSSPSFKGDELQDDKVKFENVVEEETNKQIDYFPILQCFVKIVVEFLKHEKPFLQLSQEIKEEMLRKKISEMLLIFLHLFYSTEKKHFTFALTTAETDSFDKLFGIEKREAVITQAHLDTATCNPKLIRNLVSSLDMISSIGCPSSKLVLFLPLIFYCQDDLIADANIQQSFQERAELLRGELGLEEDKVANILKEVNNFNKQNDMEFLFG